MSIEVAIRPLTAPDITACVTLYEAAYATPPYGSGWDDNTVVRIIQDLLQHFPDESFVAEAHGQIVGFILCSSLAGLRATVEEFAVAPEYQRQGVGAALLDYVIAFYGARDLPYLELVANRQAPAYAFYCRRGFQETGEYRLMSKKL